MLRKLFAFLYRDFLIAISYKFGFILTLGGILFSTAGFFFLSRLFEHTPSSLKIYGGYFPFVIIGIAFSDYLMTALHSFSSTIRQGQVTGTLEALLLTRTKVSTIVLLSSVFSFLFTTLRVFFYLLFGALVFGISFKGNILGAIIILVLTIIVFASLGIISASFVMVFKRGDPLSWIFTSASALLGGVFYPISVLPGWLRNFSFILPITYSLKGIRMCLLANAGLRDVLSQILVLSGFAVVLLPLSLFFFKSAIDRAKKDGTLTQY